jgi:hypothetical protein
LSFFDEADEPRTARREPPRRSRTGSGGGARGGGGRRPSTDPQVIRTRRLIAIAVAVVLVILIVIGVSSCESSARRSALRDYNSNVVALAQQSNSTGKQFFGVLTGGGSAHSIQTSLNQARDTADQQLSHAKKLSVPDEDKQAQGYFELVMQMRRDGIANVATQIQPALAKATSRDGVSAIASEMARLYASDALYKDYTVPLILGGLKSNGIAVGGANGQPVESGQFVPDLRWLQPDFVASELHVSSGTSTTSGPVAPGVHGHRLVSVAVAGTTLDTGSTNTVADSPAPTFTLNFANTGQNTEHNVVCQVAVQGTGITSRTTVPQTTPGQAAQCNVQLSSSPPTGTYTVAATIERVPGEKSTTRNTQTFSIDFK